MSYRTSAPSTQPLLQAVQLGELKLPNRVVMAPMTRARADNEELAPTALHATYYAQRAGAGLIISEGTWVSTDAIGFVNVPGIYTDAQTAGWTKVTEAVHSAGGRIVSQLGHTGAASHPDHHGGRLPAGPSAINPHEMSFTPDGPKDSLTPRALSAAEIATTIGTYRQAAANARRAGFDGLEIHAQVSQLVAQFLNPRLNQRTDAYGGSSEKRAQFLFDLVDAVSSVWGSDRIGIKLSPYWNHRPAFTADAETLEEYDQLLARLNDSNLAYLHLLGPEPDTGTDILTAFTRYRAHYHGPVIANLGFTQASGNELLERQLADAVSFGAPFIANPDLVDRFTHGHPLAASNRDTHFEGGSAGYTDYPAMTGSS